MFTEEDLAGLDEETQRAVRAILDKRRRFQEDERRMHEEKRQRLREALRQRQEPREENAHGDAAGGRSKGADACKSGDASSPNTLCWLPNYRAHDQSETLLPPMRYTCCESGDNCLHGPSPMLQIFDILVKCYMNTEPYMFFMPDHAPGPSVEVYGMCAIRDCLDNSRNYIYHRSRENAQVINANGGYLRLRNPARGIAAMRYLIEIDLKMKADEIGKDVTIIEGCLKGTGQEIDLYKENHVYTMEGRVTFESRVLTEGVEAMIELDFLEVPEGGFQVQMCGNTVACENLYSFITERRDCDDLIVSTGKLEKKFVVAVSMGVTLRIEFKEEGREGLSFVASKHGSEQQLYRFCNGAVVSVNVYWSTIGTGDAAVHDGCAE
ncbi:hypothetical protein ACP70R_000278 [Stipagrostis hirtigluma subsp. patula]